MRLCLTAGAGFWAKKIQHDSDCIVLNSCNDASLMKCCHGIYWKNLILEDESGRPASRQPTCGWTSSLRNYPLLPHHLLEAALGSLSTLRKCSRNLTVSRSCYLPIARKSMWTVKAGRAVKCGGVLRMQQRYPLDKLASSTGFWPHGSPLMYITELMCRRVSL